MFVPNDFWDEVELLYCKPYAKLLQCLQVPNARALLKLDSNNFIATKLTEISDGSKEIVFHDGTAEKVQYLSTIHQLFVDDMKKEEGRSTRTRGKRAVEGKIESVGISNGHPFTLD